MIYYTRHPLLATKRLIDREVIKRAGVTITARSEFVHGFCDSCIRPTKHGGCGQVFRSILEPIRCPQELCDTHEICPYCLDLYPKAWHHLEQCGFAQQKVQLNTGGWSTPASTHVLHFL